MNENLERITRVIADAIESGAKDIPPIAQETMQQVLQYGYVSSIMNFLLGASFIVSGILSFFLARHLYRRACRQNKHDDTYIAFIIIGIVVGAVGSLITFYNILAILKIQYAPNLYLLEFIKEL